MAPPIDEIMEGDESPDLPPARPAATLVVFDERAGDGAPSLLMVRRSQTMAFAGGAVVFPGGRVDADDHVLAARLGDGLDGDDAAGRVAAIRETIEETGLVVGSANGPLAADAIAAMRRDLHGGALFSALIEQHGLALDLGAVVPFARWIPNLNNHRRFDTRFYLARGSAAGGALSVDATENSALFWASAAETLALAERGEIDVIFPTRRNLERLMQYASFAEAVACTERHPPQIISPWIERRDGERFLMIPADQGYPVIEQRLETVMRG